MSDNQDMDAQDKPRPSMIARWSQGVTIFSIANAVLLLVAAMGTRVDLWNFSLGLRLVLLVFALALVVSLIALVILIISLRRPPGTLNRGYLLLGVMPSLLLAVVIGRFMLAGSQLPPIHNISTDTTYPPEFTTLKVLRQKAGANSLTYEYKGSKQEIVSLQTASYPYVKPIFSPLSPDDAFTRALALVETLGWRLVSADIGTGIIEATDTSFWFGFEDDIAIRVLRWHGGTRIDLRSVSRVGVSDLGKNANRIHRFARAW